MYTKEKKFAARIECFGQKNVNNKCLQLHFASYLLYTIVWLKRILILNCNNKKWLSVSVCIWMMCIQLKVCTFEMMFSFLRNPNNIIVNSETWSLAPHWWSQIGLAALASHSEHTWRPFIVFFSLSLIFFLLSLYINTYRHILFLSFFVPIFLCFSLSLPVSFSLKVLYYNRIVKDKKIQLCYWLL